MEIRPKFFISSFFVRSFLVFLFDILFCLLSLLLPGIVLPPSDLCNGVTVIDEQSTNFCPDVRRGC